MANWRSAHILVADDDSDRRSHLRHLLAGYEVVTVSDADAAFDAARRRRPDLVVASAGKGDRDGRQLMQKFRADLHLTDVPIVLLSDQTTADSRADALEAGADACLVAPFSDREFVACVQTQFRAAGRRTRAVEERDVVVDVTDRKHAEDTVARITAESDRMRRLYETVLSATPDFVYVFSLDHRVVYANDSLIRMWGKGRDGAIGKTFLEIGYEPWHAEMHDREIDQVRQTKQPIRGEVPFNGTSGRRIYDYIFVPVIGADGEVEAVAGTTRDVTDRKEFELTLADSDRKKDEFIALLAHELRNPLAPIRNGLHIVRQTSDLEVRERAQDMMDRQLGHMVRLIDDLLDVSRIGRNKLELRRTRVTLADVVESAVEAAQPAIDAAGHHLQITLPAEPVHLHADLTRLAQVLSNLLSNSAKYTERGGTIKLIAEPQSDVATIRVVDTGIGIPSESLPGVFDMFSQVDRSLERSAGGLGIGLALVKGLTEMHGGTVVATSAGEGHGSTFVVTLPTLPAEDEVVEAAAAARPTTARRRVLVVDDSRDGAETLAMMLELAGHEVVLAHDGVEAIDQAAAFRPELILMDVGMPRMNGLEATRRIRQLPESAAATIIALTGWGQEGDREQSREAGCDGHLVKPVDLDELHRILGNLPRGG